MARKQETFAEVLVKAPWWISAVLGLVSFAAFRWGMPAFFENNLFAPALVKAGQIVAPLALFMFESLAVVSFIFGRKRRRLVEDQSSLESLRSTSWKDFEFLVAEAFRRQGYTVDYGPERGADGGVDVTLHRDGRKTLVQCKQWKVRSVGAPVVRELLGVMTAEKAQAGIVITTGRFTREAVTFATNQPIDLIDGPGLLDLVRAVQTNPPQSNPKAPFESAPTCPSCGSPMVKRTAKRGANAGNIFWGCPTFPKCKGTRAV